MKALYHHSRIFEYIDSGKNRKLRGEVALKNNMASVSVENVEKKRKKYGHKCCGAAKCNNRSDNRPDLSFHAFPKDLKTRKE